MPVAVRSRVDPAVGALRRARRANRVQDVDWIDALYKAYVTAFLSLLAVFLLAGATGDEPVTGGALQDVRDWGAPVVSAVTAVIGLAAVRSGRRGGPLALEGPDVTHIMLAPVDRGPVLRSLALRQLRFFSFVGVASGAAVGYLASRRLPGATLAWLGAGAGQGLVVVAFALGLGYFTAGSRQVLVAGGMAVLAGATGLLGDSAVFGAVALLPLDQHGGAVVAALAAGGLAALVLATGLAHIDGLSIEAAEWRSRLVGELRFAVTLQDLRTALVLRRQLAQERPRVCAWYRLRPSRPLRRSVWRRGWHGVLRWPGIRIVRLLALGAVAGLALRGAFEGTAPLVVVAGVALWIAALDAVEPVAQEIDHPDRLAGAPVVEPLVHLHLVLVSGCVLLPAALVAVVAGALAGDHQGTAALVGLVTVPSAVLCAVGGAARAVRGSDPTRRLSAFVPSPEAMGMAVAARLIWPPAVAIAGTLPVLAARAAANGTAQTPMQGAVSAAVPLTMMLGGLLLAYVRFADDARAWWDEFTGAKK